MLLFSYDVSPIARAIVKCCKTKALDLRVLHKMSKSRNVLLMISFLLRLLLCPRVCLQVRVDTRSR